MLNPKKWRSKEIRKYWPEGVDFSNYKLKIIRRELKKRDIRNPVSLRLMICELMFKPSTQEFDCEISEITCYATPKRYCNVSRMPANCQPAGGGWRNIRSSDSFS